MYIHTRYNLKPLIRRATNPVMLPHESIRKGQNGSWSIKTTVDGYKLLQSSPTWSTCYNPTESQGLGFMIDIWSIYSWELPSYSSMAILAKRLWGPKPPEISRISRNQTSGNNMCLSCQTSKGTCRKPLNFDGINLWKSGQSNTS